VLLSAHQAASAAGVYGTGCLFGFWIRPIQGLTGVRWGGSFESGTKKNTDVLFVCSFKELVVMVDFFLNIFL
jgi:hypothetical protein